MIGILRRVSVSIFKSNFKEANKKFIILWFSENFERPWKLSAHTQKVLIKMFRTSRKNYPSHDTVPLLGFSLKKIAKNGEGPVTSSVCEIRCW
jgi:hypothetical protein